MDIKRELSYYTDALKKYAVFGGRASRQAFWMFFGYAAVIDILIVSPIMLLKGVAATVIAVIWLIYTAAMVIPCLAIIARRIHDINLSAWLILVGLIPSISQLLLFIFSVIKGTVGDNKYGPDPYKINTVQQADIY